MSAAQRIRARSFTLLISVCSLILCAQAHTLDFGGVGGIPAYPRADVPRSSSIFIHTLEPGTDQEDAVIVSNTTNERKTVLVNAVDNAKASGGAFACSQLLDTQSGVGTWVTLEKNEIALDPQETTTVPFVITVPESAVPGEYNGCIVIETLSDRDGEETTGLTISTRVGIRVAITVPGEFVRELTDPGVTMTVKENGDYVFNTVIKNKGTVSIDTAVSLKVRSLLGPLHREAGGTFPVLRESVSDRNFEIEKPFWGGPYIASVAFQYDSDSDGKNDETIKGSKTLLFVFPHIAALIIEIILLLILIILCIRIYNKKRGKIRRSRKRKAKLKNNTRTRTRTKPDSRRHGHTPQ